jgi:broad specificity phosphatase PhoE
MAPKFIFLRHGEALHNLDFHTRGSIAFTDEANRDAPLSLTGVKQAQKAADALSSLNIISIWSSPLTRCIQTAEEVFEEVNVQGSELYLYDNLLERLGNGHMINERKEKQVLKEKFPLWKRDYLPDKPCHWISHENDYALRQRMYMIVMLLADIYKEHTEEEHILIVGHSDAIATLTGRSLKNAEYAIFTLKELTE